MGEVNQTNPVQVNKVSQQSNKIKWIILGAIIGLIIIAGVIVFIMMSGNNSSANNTNLGDTSQENSASPTNIPNENPPEEIAGPPD